MILLTIINSLAILWILFHNDFSVRKDVNFGLQAHILLGLWFYYKRKGFLYIPFRNSRKVEVKENIKHMLKQSDQSRHQILGAKFSWLKTIEEVNQFVKDYRSVDTVFVDKLVKRFTEK